MTLKAHRYDLNVVSLSIFYFTEISRNVRSWFLRGNIAVVAGTVLLSSPGVEYQIEESIIHPDFGASGERFGNDIALLKTKKNIDFSDNVTSVLLPEKDIDVGTNVTIAGWGYTEEQIKSDNLLYYTARTVDLEECRKQLQISISDEDLCAFSRKGQGVCYGDSGSLLIDTESRVLHGIVSRGIPCAVGKPDIFTGVYSYIEWIKSYIE